MKVVLFCGGQGMRLREYSEKIPKPLVTVGYRPILWHVMKYYATYGHKDFILCLGYMGDRIKDYFLKYDETLSNDFVMTRGGDDVRLLHTDIDDWRITFVDTGLQSNIGERLMKVQKHLEGESEFLANYSDGLSDLPLDDFLADFRARDAIGSFVSVPAPHSFHTVQADDEGFVQKIEEIGQTDVRINGGFFAFRGEIFDYMKTGEELVLQPFDRLIKERKLVAYPYDGFWKNMDTFKDKQSFDDLMASGNAPWELWRK